MPGRPKKLDSAKQDQICALITVGCTRRTAAQHTGVSCTGIRNLARRDREFADRLQRAEMLREANALKHIYNAGAKNWRTAAWLLERTFPDDYARKRPKSFSYDEARGLMEEVWETLAQYITDREARQEAYDRVTNIINRDKRNACAASDPFPRRRHRCKFAADDEPIQELDQPDDDHNPSLLAFSNQTHDDEAQPNWSI